MASTMDSIIFIIGGAPGSGKGTLCKKLCEDHGFAHLSVGDTMRNVMSSVNTDSQFMDCMRSGQLVPVETLAPILKNQVDRERRNGSKVVLIDGFPRRLDQATCVEALLGSPKLVLFFNCPEEVAMKRFLTRRLAGRETDDQNMFIKRFQEFEKLNPEIVDHYRSRDILLEVDTSGETEASFQKLMSTLKDADAWRPLAGVT